MYGHTDLPADVRPAPPQAERRNDRMGLENVSIDQWLCGTEDETAVSLDPDCILGPLNDIEEDLRTHSRKYEHQLMQNAA